MAAGIVLADALRTPFGRLGGALKDYSAVELGAHAVRQLLDRAGIAPREVSEVYIGSAVLAASTLVAARQIIVKAGLPPETPSLTVDRACCSSMTAIGLGLMRARAGEADIVVAGGVESCSQTPFLQRQTRWGHRLGDLTVEDPLQFRNPITQEPLARVTGEVALEHGVSRDEQDDWAHASHQKYFTALDAGLFAEEIAPIERRGAQDREPLLADESPRRAISREKLRELSPVYGSPTVTAGNAPGLNDGASAVILMSRELADSRGIEPLCEVISYVQIAGSLTSSPYLPGDAIAKALEKAHIGVRDLALIEINEAFAAMPLVSTKRLAGEASGLIGHLRAITNTKGGAVAIGHPTGASGARLVMTLARGLRQRGGAYGAAAICGGFGQADAIVIKV
jgi:acetyl-CoA C-acetyltransferase